MHVYDYGCRCTVDLPIETAANEASMFINLWFWVANRWLPRICHLGMAKVLSLIVKINSFLICHHAVQSLVVKTAKILIPEEIR